MHLQSDLQISRATPQDVPRVIALMRQLAEFEDLLDECIVTEDLLSRHVFCEHPIAELFVGRLNGDIRGYALCFHNFSTFRGRPGMYLEDIYVEPLARGMGLGKALLLAVARLARDRKCPRFEWAVLDWNTKAQAFYKSLGAKPLEDWTLYRMDETAIAALVSDTDP